MDTTKAKYIEESGMRFGPFMPGDIFPIETSTVYRQLGDTYKTVEFVCLKGEKENRRLLFIEAKSSSPNPNNRESPAFDRWIGDVAEKFRDSWQLFLAAKTGIRDASEVGTTIRETPLSQCRVLFVLVISNHELEWLPPVRDALAVQLRKLIGLWKIQVIALNREIALSRKLITR